MLPFFRLIFIYLVCFHCKLLLYKSVTSFKYSTWCFVAVNIRVCSLGLITFWRMCNSTAKQKDEKKEVLLISITMIHQIFYTCYWSRLDDHLHSIYDCKIFENKLIRMSLNSIPQFYWSIHGSQIRLSLTLVNCINEPNSYLLNTVWYISKHPRHQNLKTNSTKDC